MTAEEIVRRLAAEGPPLDNDDVYFQVCALCHVNTDDQVGLTLADHIPECLWRLAVELVAADVGGELDCPACNGRGTVPRGNPDDPMYVPCGMCR